MAALCVGYNVLRCRIATVHPEGHFECLFYIIIIVYLDNNKYK